MVIFPSEDGLKDKGQRSWEPPDEPEPAAEESLGVLEGGWDFWDLLLGGVTC